MSTRRRHWGALAPAAVVVTFGLCLSAVTPAVASGTEPAAGNTPHSATGISQVAVANKTVTVSGKVESADAGVHVTITESGAQSTANPADATVFGQATAGADGAFSVTAPRAQTDGTDSLYGEFDASVDGATVGVSHFADRLEFTPANSAAYPNVPDKKGLQVQMTDDAESLGVQHAAINVDLAGIMLNKKTAANNIVFASGGKNYYFDAANVKALDTQIKALSDNGTLVNLILLVLRHSGEQNSAVSQLGDPDASSAPGSGPIVGFNTRTAEGVRYTTAAMEFIASRWSRTDAAYGRADGYIVGNEVDAQWAWANSGDKTIDQFLNTYSRALRITSLATRKYAAAARTYTSLDHNWTVASGPNPNPANPTRFYDSKDVVYKLNQISKATGDFPWFIAFHPYPQDLFKPDFWNDTEATNSIDSKLITFKNIQVLPQYLAQPTLEYQGHPRRIILSEQGCNTPGNGSNLSLDAQKLQAACFAYAYYKIRFLPSIDSFILHRHVDNKGEGGLNLGLWTADYSVSSASAPLRKKYIYNVYKYIDTPRSLEVTNFAKSIIGITDWKDVIPGFDAAALDQRPITTTVGTRVDGAAHHESSLGVFTAGADGWMPSDNAATAVPVNGMLHVTSVGGTFALQYRGVVKTFGRNGPKVGGSWLRTSVRIPADAGLGLENVVRLTATLASGTVVEGDGRVRADGAFHVVALQVPEQDKASLAKLKVRVRGTGPAQPQATFDLKSVGVARNVGASRQPNVLIAAQAASADLVGTTINVSLTNLDTDTLRGALRLPGHCGNFTLTRHAVLIPATKFGDSSSLQLTVKAVQGAGNTLCVAIGHGLLKVPVVVPPPTEHPIFEFETGTDGWVAAAGVDSIAQVTSFANGPGAPQSGTGAVEATTPAALATTPRTITNTLTTGLDLSKAATVYVWVDSYGGVPGATGYTATFTLTSTDGSSVHVTTNDFKPDSWNKLAVDVRSWTGRSSISSTSVSFAALGSTYPTWNPRFQIDNVGYFTS